MMGDMADWYDLWIYYPRPADAAREARLCEIAARHGGELYHGWCRDLPNGHEEGDPLPDIWTTFLFADHDAAVRARQEFRERGEIANFIGWIGD